MDAYGTFAATERLLMELARAGADRQAMHEVIRQHAVAAWQAVQAGEPNPLVDRLAADAEILRYLPEERVRALLGAREHIGNAPERARRMAGMMRELV
jgi:adenylosuccinate lyase